MDLAAASDLVRSRLDRETQAARSTVVVPLPVADGEWLGKFGVLPPDRLDAVQAAILGAEGSAQDGADAAAAYVAEALRCLCVFDDEGKVQEVTDEGRPVKWSLEWAQAIGMDPPEESLEGVVKGVWTLDDGSLNAVALDSFAERLMNWSQDTNRRIRGEVVGESRGSTPSGERAEQPPTE